MKGKRCSKCGKANTGGLLRRGKNWGLCVPCVDAERRRFLPAVPEVELSSLDVPAVVDLEVDDFVYPEDGPRGGGGTRHGR